MIDPTNWGFEHENRAIRDNFLRALEFRNPDWIPCSIGFFPAVWDKYREKLADIVNKHPFIFGPPRIRSYDNLIPVEHRPNTYWRDNWGCRWYSSQGGYEGQVMEHPLADWKALASYHPPDPNRYTERGRRHWWGERNGCNWARKNGVVAGGNAERLFDRMYALRGFDQLMRDFAANDPHLPQLIQMLQTHEMRIIKRFAAFQPDIIYFHTDIGTQDRLMISPKQFRKFIKPMFMTLFQACRKAGMHVYLSSDGYLLDIVDDLIECGVSVHDPQFRANGLEGIAKQYKGKMCIDLDLDRQAFPFASPDQLRTMIKDSVEMLGSPAGGLMMKAEISDVNVPLENIEAICLAFEEFCIMKR
jgi:hypothetical protein